MFTGIFQYDSLTFLCHAYNFTYFFIREKIEYIQQMYKITFYVKYT